MSEGTETWFQHHETTAVGEIDGNSIFLSTLDTPKGSKTPSGQKVLCAFCDRVEKRRDGKEKGYRYSPSLSEEHLLDLTGKRNVHRCTPLGVGDPLFKRQQEVKAEVARRRRERLEAEREQRKRKLDSLGGSTTDAIDVEELGTGGAAAKKQQGVLVATERVVSAAGAAPIAAAVTQAWGKAILRCCLPLDVVNSEAFRDAVTLTAMCGPGYLSTRHVA